ncbi:hypothetical protein FACS1894133_6890 [Clostridia bacterium]|nr:hypothetical protein FACS1894133_6890 [Clostridia bacterium]
MNVLQLKEATQDYVVYLYQPNGEGTFGEIKTEIGGEPEIISRAGTDETGSYARKACAKVKEFIDKKNLSMRYTQAWY